MIQKILEKLLIGALVLFLVACGSSTPSSKGNSANTNLADITLSAGELNQAFQKGLTNYTATVENAVERLSITPIAEDNGAKLLINGMEVVSGRPSTDIMLEVGENEISVEVIAADGATKKVYSLIITRVTSSNAKLAALALSSGVLNQAFVSSTDKYWVTVPYNVTSMSLTPSVEDPTATVTVNGVNVKSGHPSVAIPLTLGNGNILNVEVTAQDGQSQQNYTITITRLDEASSANNVAMPEIVLEGGASVVAADETGTSFVVPVANDVTTFTFTPSVTDPDATMKVNNTTVAVGDPIPPVDLAIGNNEITIVITDKFGVNTATYTVNVVREARTNADLAALTVSGGGLSPMFDAGINAYTVDVANDVSSITVTPETADIAASVMVNNIAQASGSPSAPISLAVGQTNIDVLVVAQDGITTRTYTITVNRQGAANVDLSGLVIPGVTLSPAFSSATTNYTADVANGVSEVTVQPTAADNTSIIKVNNVVVASGATSGAVTLGVGANDIVIYVASADNTANKMYTVTVTRAGSNNADLSNLTLSAGTLSFSAGTTAYNVSVANATSSIQVTPTVADSGATVKVNGTAVISGSTSSAIPLVEGSNTINVVVTAQDSSTKTYALTINRPSANTNLTSLSVSGGFTLSPAFDAGVTSYNVTVGNSVTNLDVTAATSATSTSTLTIASLGGSANETQNVSLSVGDNSIPVEVTAQDSSSLIYTLTIHRKSTVADLSGLLIAGVNMSDFVSGTTTYNKNASYATNSVTVTPTASHAAATITVNGASVANGGTSNAINLSVGIAVPIDVVVTAEDGNTKTYTVNITQAAPATNADLSNLAPSDGSLDTAFSAADLSYAVTVGNAVSSFKLTPTLADTNATVKVNGTAVTSGSPSASVTLNVGDNLINTVVTAEDGTTTKTYAVTVHRQSGDASLSGLLVSGVSMSDFASGTATYNKSVAYSVGSVTVTPTSNDSTASITVDSVSVNSGAASGGISLTAGASTPITVVVTAEDPSISQTYTVNIARAAASTNANLSNLVPSSGSLDTAFSAADLSYNVTVGNAVNSITLTPTVADSNATVTVNGGSPSASVSLTVGDNLINTVVTAEDGTTTKTYAVTVHRQSGDASLSGLLVSNVSMSDFASGTYTYNKNVAYSIGSVAVTPTANDSTATITVNGLSVNSGSASSGISLTPTVAEPISIVVTAEDTSITQTYTVNVTRLAASNDATLSALTISSGALTPSFSAGTSIYTVSVGTAVTSITMTATANDANYSGLTINSIAETSGAASGNISLAVGNNPIDVVVTAEDGTTTSTYTVTVARTAITKTVCASGCDYSTIQGAINNAVDGTTIQVSDGTYAEAVTFGSKNVVVTSVNGAASTTITGDNTNNPVVTFNGADAAVLDGFTINNSYANGNASRGIYITNSATPTISNSIITGNSMIGGSTNSLGAGIELIANTGTTVLDGVSITGNQTKWGSGGIHMDASSLSIIGTTHIDNNTVTQGSGGAIYATNGSSLSINASGVATSSISGNAPSGSSAGIYFDGSAGGSIDIANISIDTNVTVNGYGGGLYLNNVATTTTISNVSISSNQAKYGSGGIYAVNATIDLNNVTVDGNTLTQDVGAGIRLITGSSATIVNSSVSNNTTNASGAGIYMDGGTTATLSISNTTIDNNFGAAPSGYGGGVFLLNVAGTTDIVDSSISNNKAKWSGGGLYASGSVVNISNTTINGNSLTQGSGGGVWLDTVGSSITGATINDNISTGNGGGVWTSAGLTVDKTFIQGNKTTTDGGGLYTNADLTMTNSVVSGNLTTTASATRDGGGIFMGGLASTRTLTNVTVVGNRSYDYGGIYVEDGGTTTINNSVLYSNTAYQGTGDLLDNQLGGLGTITLNYSVIEDGWAGAGTGNQSTKPAFVDEQVASGATPTSAGDFRLCIDTNTPAASCPDTGAYPSIGLDLVPATSDPQTADILGNPRATDIPGVGNEGSDFYDAGAYEYLLSSDNNLTALALGVGSLDQSFQSASTSYTMTVGYVVQDITVTPSLSYAGATMTVNGQAVSDGAVSQAVSLTAGATTDINVVVTAEDGTTQTYTITVTRQSLASFAQQAYVKASNTGAGDYFGNAVDISGDWMVVAARKEDGSITSDGGTFDNNSTTDGGGVYVFKRTSGTWAQQAYLKPEVFLEASAGFGWDVAIDGDTIVVGMPGNDNWAYTGVYNVGDVDWTAAQNANWSDMNTGAAFVFRDTSGTGAGTWAQEAFILPAFLNQSYGFGRSVDIQGDTIIVGTQGDDNATAGVQNTSGAVTVGGTATDSGAAWIYVRSGTTWSQQAYLKPDVVAGATYAGISVAIDGDTAVYTAPGDSTGGTRTGAVHVFARSGTTWSYQAKLQKTTPVAEDRMGGCRVDTNSDGRCYHFIGISGDSIVVGVPGDDTAANGAGAAVVFTRSGSTWSQQQILTTSNAATGDLMGGIAIEGDTIVMAQYAEDSNSTGINSTANDLATDTGAAYVFTRSGGVWTERYYIKSHNPTNSDTFGEGGCAISGDTVACATRFEDGSGTGIDPVDDNAAADSGAVYIFQ